MESELTTEQAAQVVGINRATLQRWIRAGAIKAPKLQLRNGRGIRLWSTAYIERLMEAKRKVYRKGRGRKAEPKT